LNEDWEAIGTKADLADVISECTRFPAGMLTGDSDLETFSVAQRMSWAARRTTSRVEDCPYCLMGIFGIKMALMYGERETAFIRLQEGRVEQLDIDIRQRLESHNGAI
jgi:hypothetical protein